ncbi:hypothetical protein [Selenomonas ruminantium]|uniref:PD-(D/E)XK nuclease superfamily protein n=1 Tax=Selenomonas ruminantium TaxID=971 RepID=A0A1H3VSD8_SELRU|nr:hypothetical protein [Selenomonas ruminantium]SDZ77018.1 hypothetical protein SAMN05660648_00483 [Selenomonas ruminantium]
MQKPVIIKYKHVQSLINGAIAYNGLVITANQQMAEAFRKNGVNTQVMEVNMVMRVLLPEWYENTRKLEQFILLDEIIRALEAEYTGKETGNVFRAMYNNKSELIASISALVEIGAESAMLPAESQEQKIFRRIYQEFISDGRSGVGILRKRLFSWERADSFKRELTENVMRTTGRAIGIPRAVYFQGFYYITPLQARLVNAFRQLNIPVYFLNNMNDEDPVYYEIWEKNPRFQEKMAVRWADEDEASSTKAEKKRSIVKYRDAFAMVRKLEKVKAGNTVIYAVMSRQVKELLETFFPERAEKSQLMAYPVGRYLLSLYNMWDDEAGLVLEPDNVRACLSTGWAGSRYEDSKKLLSTYDMVQDYFRACRTVDEWRAAMDRLQEVKQKIMPLFEHTSGEHLGRWREIVTNPFHNLGAFSASDERLAELTSAIKHMAEDAQMLFAGGDTLSLKEHFRKVYKLLKDKAPRELLYEEETEVLRIMLGRLQGNPQHITECRPAGLAEAMSFFLGGKLEDEEAIPDDEVFGPVRGLSDIESAQILHSGKKFMVCGCDSQNMPGQSRPYPWPLTQTYIKSLTCQNEVKARCQDYLHCMDNALLGNRYLFHLADQLEDVEFSWMELVNDKEVNPSVYLLQLKEAYKLTIKDEKQMLKELPEEAAYAGDDNKLTSQAMAVFTSEEKIWPTEIKMDQEFCPQGSWRLFYDYILASHPVFSSTFQMQFYIAVLISLMADMASCSYETAAEQVFVAYPAFNEAEQQERLDFAKRYKTDALAQERQPLADREYTLKRHYLQYLSIDTVNTYLQGGTITPENKEKMCAYCPHKAYCFVKGDAAK